MGFPIAESGKSRTVIVVDPAATPTEIHAASELRRWLGEITGVQLPVVRTIDLPRDLPCILVGPGTAARGFAKDIRWGALGEEEGVVRSKGNRLLLAGGRPRGTLMAVHRFLQSELGIRWWTPWATSVPKQARCVVADMDRRENPAFEARNPFWYHAFDADWAVRNGSNAQDARLDAKHGGGIQYKGFVHTFYPLVDPKEHFATHPEWFSMDANGKRYVERGQLCTTNPELREHIVGQVRRWLKETPDAKIVSISQNDWYGACLCPECKAIDTAEGSSSGSMLALVNHVAQQLEREFPGVAFDTLAYQYTRKAPAKASPRPSVVVRLCSIECDFRQPLESKANGSFGDDIRSWNTKSKRLYVWDYVTNFSHYLLPHPNWFELGPNVRFFHRNGVKGLFEQGAYQSHGAEMAELRAWVLARLMWDPSLDDRALIREFLEGYYGREGAPFVQQYLALLHARSAQTVLTCFGKNEQPFLDFETLVDADGLWRAALSATKDPARRWRLEQGRNCVRYAILANWRKLRRECRARSAAWPWGEIDGVAKEFLRHCSAPGPKGWKPITHLNESGLTPAAFVARLQALAGETSPLPGPFRQTKGALGVSDSVAELFQPGTLVERRTDKSAADGKALRMPARHTEWAIQFPAANLPEGTREGKWSVHAVVRFEGTPAAQTPVLSAGVYSRPEKRDLTRVDAKAGTGTSDWHLLEIGSVVLADDTFVWLAPIPGEGLEAVWVDRLILVPAS